MKTHSLDTIVNTVKSIIRLPRARKRSRPFIYSIKTVAVFFYTMMLKGIACFKTMHKSLMNNPTFANICGFKGRLPDRTTLSSRFKGLYEVLKDQMRHMGDLLTKKEVTAPYMCSVDSTMHKAHGNIWHKAKALLITPMRRHKHMHPERKVWLKFYRSKIGKKRYSQRSKTIDPLIGHIKDVFNIEKLKVKGLQNVRSFLSLCIWIYQTLIYYNFIYQRPLKRIKDLVCAI